jgi:hypothetical protein
MIRIFSKALIVSLVLQILSASLPWRCSKLSYIRTNSFNVGAKGRHLRFSYRTTGTGTNEQELGEIVLLNDEEVPEVELLAVKLTLFREDKGVSLLVSVINLTDCADFMAQGSQCDLKTTPADVFPVVDDCTFSFTPSPYGHQTLGFEEEGGFLVLFINRKKVGKIARPCGHGFYKSITGISGKAYRLLSHSCN